MDEPTASTNLSVAIGGLGAIGLPVARRLDAGIGGLELTAVSARNRTAAQDRIAELRRPVPVVPLDRLAEHAAIVVECAPAAVFADVAESAVAAGRTLVTVSVGALLARMDLVERAKATGARIIVPTGALLGLDAVRAAAEGKIVAVTLITRKPPAGLQGAPYLTQRGIDLEGLTAPLKVFDGPASAAAEAFPANVNVAAALALAGIGPDRTTVELWADPGVTRNTHTVEVEADSARFSMSIEGIPSADNPRTGRLTPLSVIAALRRLVSPLQVGT